MSGPIVRSGATQQFSENWDRIFGGKAGKKPSAKGAKKKLPAKAASSAVAKSTKKKPAAAKKPAKKKGR